MSIDADNADRDSSGDYSSGDNTDRRTSEVDYSTLEGIGITETAPTGPSPSNSDIAESSGFTGSWGTDGWASSSPEPTTVDAPSKKNLGYDWGIRPAGTTLESMLEDEASNPSKRDLRMSKVGGLIDKMGMMALNAVPGGSQAMTVAKAVDAVQNKGMSIFDAMKTAAFDIGGGYVAGQINGAVGKAVGPEVSQAISAYNKFGSLANLANPGSMPGFSPGTSAVNKAKEMVGYTGFGKPSGMTMPDGQPAVSVGGWASDSRTSEGGSTPSAVEAPSVVEAPSLSTNMRFNLSDQARSSFGAIAR